MKHLYQSSDIMHSGTSFNCMGDWEIYIQFLKTRGMLYPPLFLLLNNVCWQEPSLTNVDLSRMSFFLMQVIVDVNLLHLL